MTLAKRKFLITGANGFIGKNIVVRLSELPSSSIFMFIRGDREEELFNLVAEVDCVIHLAGENRPTDQSEFCQVNTQLTKTLCNAISQQFKINGRHVRLIFASSQQAALDNPYGRSTLAAEMAIKSLAEDTGNPCVVFRLPGVFGKWCKPNYNSVVATFCHNISRNLPIQISNPSAIIKLAYVDDVVTTLLASLDSHSNGYVQAEVNPIYTTTLGELADQIQSFGDLRSKLMTDRVGSGYLRALYATYVSHLPENKFSYEIPQYVDNRGMFVEVLKTVDSGQFSYFTAHPGVTRGGHYHHTKTEKFLVIKGHALFRFRNLVSKKLVEMHTSGMKPQMVDTIPGWSHDITNVGDDEMIVMLWANENFDSDRPDTVSSKV